MKDEIKEILDNFEKYEARYRLRNETQFIITHREIQILLDYITNLQEENKILKELNVCVGCNNNSDYKSRIEKAREYIEKSMNNPQPFYEYLFGNENGEVENLDKLLNILNGGDE